MPAPKAELRARTHQHLTVPSRSVAHVWARPVATAATTTVVPSFTAGSASPMSEAFPPRATVSPTPSWPEVFEPLRRVVSAAARSAIPDHMP